MVKFDHSGNFGELLHSCLALCLLKILSIMFQAAVRSAVRPAVKAATRSASRSSFASIRTISTTPSRFSDSHGHIKSGDQDLFGPGAKVGEVPSEVDQATGLERLELLAEMQGQKLFDEEPLPAEFIGTNEKPVMVYSLVRVVLPLASLIIGFLSLTANLLCYLGYRAYHWMHGRASRLP